MCLAMGKAAGRWEGTARCAALIGKTGVFDYFTYCAALLHLILVFVNCTVLLYESIAIVRDITVPQL